MFRLDDNEKLEKVLRKHWFVYVLDIIILFILFILPYIAFRVTGLDDTLDLSGKTYDLAVFLYACWFLLLWVYFFVAWTNKYLDAWVITNVRIVSIDQVNLFSRDVTSTHYEKIQDIAIKTRGIIRTLLGFGDIEVETAGKDDDILIKDIPNPEEVKLLISRHYHRVLKDDNTGDV